MKNVLYGNRINKHSMYILYWAGYVLLLSLIQGFEAGRILTALYNELFGLLPKIVFVLLIVEWLMEALFFKKRIVRFVAMYVLLLLVFAFVQRLIDNYIILTYFLTDWSKQSLLSTPPFLYSVIKLQFVVTIPLTVKLFYYWSTDTNRAQAIGAEKMQAELQFLRNQFHPHFMFNVLNSLYSKVLSKSDTAGDMVLNISSLLRFSVYDANDKNVSLLKEIEYLSSYISLQQIRFDERLQLSFSVAGTTDNKFIEPFLLLPFVENSFKYCMNDELAGGWVTIFISVKEEWLTLKIENSLPQNSSTDDLLPSATYKGFGLVNVRRRLDLLYPDSHELKINETGNSFFVSLKLPLYGAIS